MSSIDQNHQSKRKLLRIAGPLILLAGLGFMLVGFVDFIISMSSFGPPHLFWCFFIGIPLLFAGTVLSVYGFMGSVARYSAGEMAPVAKDTFNYMADGTQQGMKTVASSIGAGLAAGLGGRTGQEPKIRCSKCNEMTDTDSRFCPACGASLLKSKPCSSCGELNDGDARFCDNCGQSLAS